MDAPDFPLLPTDTLVAEPGRNRLCRARVVEMMGADRVVVEILAHEDCRVVCELPEFAEGLRLLPEPGDTVMVWLDATERSATVLGRIRRARVATAPDELIIEARRNLTLKCGEGSITIREDGKILIKGRDLVSHAKRMNRIRGGSVSIN